MRFVVPFALTLVLASTGAAAGPLTSQAYRDQAARIAGEDLHPLYLNFCDLPGQTEASTLEIPATRVFDNLVFLGRGKWNSWALLTSEGIILFDAMETSAEAERYIAGGLRTLGLDPAAIRYVVVMHGHGDHFGGAKWLHDRFGARVLMSEADWQLVEGTARASHGVAPGTRVRIGNQQAPALKPDQPVPERDMVITDGMTLRLGDTSVRLYLTPGHTHGTASALLPLRDGQRRQTGAYWGGTGFDAGRADLSVYLRSVERFARVTRRAGADVALSNHPTNDTTLMKLPALAARKADAVHPFVIGKRGYQRVLGTLGACVRAAQAGAP
jgi:metallo-beta-lactamase class B